MNQLDDFLKSKLNNASFDAPSGWEALNQALPVKKTVKPIAIWAVSVAVFTGIVASLVLFNHNSNESSTTQNVSNPVVNATSTNQDVYAGENESQSKTPASVAVVNSTPASTKSVAVPSKLTSNSGKNTLSAPSATTKNNENVDNGKKESQEIVNTKSTVESVKVDEKNESKVASVVATKTESTEENSPSTPNKFVKTKLKTKGDFHKGKFYVSAATAMVGSYRSYQLNNGAAPYVNKLYDNLRQNSEEASVSAAFSVALEYRFLKNFSIQAGLGYNKTGYKSTYDFEITDKATTDPVTGRITGYEQLSATQQISTAGKTNITVLRIPVGVNYNLLFNDKSLFHIYVGGSQDIILSASGTSLDQLNLQQKPLSKNDFVKTARELCVDLGVNYAVAPNYGLGIDLFYNKWITDISKNKYENVSPFSGGINVSLTRKIF